jgi:hypothetical protein
MTQPLAMSGEKRAYCKVGHHVVEVACGGSHFADARIHVNGGLDEVIHHANQPVSAKVLHQPDHVVHRNNQWVNDAFDYLVKFCHQICGTVHTKVL